MHLMLPALSTLFLALAALLVPTDAIAEERTCITPETGHWINTRARTQQIRRIEIESRCVGKDGVAFRIRAFVKCAPRDCKWGWVQAHRNATGRIVATFPGLFGAREIEIITMDDRIEALVTLHPHDRNARPEFHAAIMTRQ
jgi:hypothetical protein